MLSLFLVLAQALFRYEHAPYFRACGFFS